MRTFSRTFAAGALASALAIPAAVSAGTIGANLGVSATVGSSCLITTSPVAFGAYNPGSATTADTSGSLTVTCASGTTYSVGLDAGGSASTAGNVGTRRMTAGASKFLPYQLYLDSGYMTIWGDGANGSSVNPVSGTFTGTGAAQVLTVYGRVGTGHFVPAGSYIDTVVATVTYN